MTTEAEAEAAAWEAAAWEEQLIANLRANGGRPKGGPMDGQPILLMYSTGAKTGKRRRSVLTYSKDGDGLVVAGTAAGSPVHPAWVANVSRNRSVELEVDDEVYPASATVYREGAERDRLWDQHVRQLPWFADDPSQVGGRIIPVVRLSRSA
jgi:deazaflavin-dependent oxidoreductase (nitroreductase family)